MKKITMNTSLVAAALLITTMSWFSFTEKVPAGHVGVGSVFGNVNQSVYDEGLHFVNPVMKMTLFDARQKTLKDQMGVPSRDQLKTTFHLSIQYRLIKGQAPSMLTETGTPQEVIDVHMTPLLRSLMREIGKSVENAEEFYNQEVQQRIQTELLEGLSELSKKGIMIDRLLIRDVTLPKIITDAVTRKKEAAQLAEKAKEDLKKFVVDQERKEKEADADKRAALVKAGRMREVMLISANAKLEAAIIDAKATIITAEAQAQAKKKQIDVVGIKSYVKLESMKALGVLQNGNHMVILDPNAVNPVPFMNLTK